MTRTFSGGPDSDQIIAWCRIALRAPSAGFSQGTHLVILDGPGLDEFWRVSGAGDWFASRNPGVLLAPTVVVVGGRRSAYTTRYSEIDKAGHGLEDEAGWAVPFWLTDSAMVAQNLLLLVEESGAGALFFGLFRNVATVLELVGAPADFEPVGAVAIGWRAPGDRPSGSALRTPRRDPAELIHLGGW